MLCGDFSIVVKVGTAAAKTHTGKNVFITTEISVKIEKLSNRSKTWGVWIYKRFPMTVREIKHNRYTPNVTNLQKKEI